MTEKLLETWRYAFRNGVGPAMSDEELMALAQGLAKNDPRITQGQTTVLDDDGQLCATCPLGYAGWKGGRLDTKDEVEEYVVELCEAADCYTGMPSCARYVMNWIDDTKREVVVKELLSEVYQLLAWRKIEEKEAEDYETNPIEFGEPVG